MFNKPKNGAVGPAVQAIASPAPRPGPKRASVPTIVSTDMTVQGNMSSAGELQVEGTVIGDIDVAKLIISAGGSVIGDISAQDLRVCGTLQGSARANTVVLTASAVMTGDVHHELLTIETGARLEGHCKRLTVEGEAPVLLEGVGWTAPQEQAAE